MGKARQHANFKSGTNLHVDIDNNRVGVGITTPSTTLQVSGTITCVDINSTSDINLKENIHSINNSLDKVLQLNGVGFDWKVSKESSVGVIAQDVEEIIPELVKISGDTKTVNYNGLVALLIEAVKEQQIQIEELKKQINK